MKKLLLVIAVAVSFVLSGTSSAVVIQGESSAGVYPNVAVSAGGALSTTLAAGTAVIGHVITDTTSTTAVTQATGTNLHTVVDSGTITTVSTVTAVTGITNALPAGTNNIGKVTTTVPNATTVTAITLTTAATGTNYTAYGSNTCTALDIVNNSGTVVEYRRGAAGTAIPIQAASSRLVIGITNSSAIDVRRTDTSNTQVAVVAECIVN